MAKIILLADDDCDDFEIFKEALEQADCTSKLFRAQNGIGVFDYLQNPLNPKPDVIFLDLNMPVMNGWQCLAKLKNTRDFELIPVIMYTTSSHFRDVEIAKDLNAHGLITKPSNPRILTRVLQRIICALDTENLSEAIKDAYLITQDSGSNENFISPDNPV
jgi:CheY-like chemotaxis protein